MEVISSALGFVLKFETLKELEGIILNLQKQVEWIKTNDVKRPFLYCVCDDRPESETIESWLESIKEKNK